MGYIRVTNKDLKTLKFYEPDEDDEIFIDNFLKENNYNKEQILKSIYKIDKLFNNFILIDFYFLKNISKKNKPIFLDNLESFDNNDILFNPNNKPTLSKEIIFSKFPIKSNLIEIINYVREKRFKLLRPIIKNKISFYFCDGKWKKLNYKPREKIEKQYRKNSKIEHEKLKKAYETVNILNDSLYIKKMVIFREKLKMLKILSLKKLADKENLNEIKDDFLELKDNFNNQVSNNSIEEISFNKYNNTILKSQKNINEIKTLKVKKSKKNKKNNNNNNNNKNILINSSSKLSNTNPNKINENELNNYYIIFCNIIEELNSKDISLSDITYKNLNNVYNKLKHSNKCNPNIYNEYNKVPFKIYRRIDKFNDCYIDIINWKNKKDKELLDNYINKNNDLNKENVNKDNNVGNIENINIVKKIKKLRYKNLEYLDKNTEELDIIFNMDLKNKFDKYKK